MLKDWIRRQRAQQLVNLRLVHYVDAAATGSRLDTAVAAWPFHVVRDVFVAGRPAIACRLGRLPFDLFTESLPRDRRGLTKRWLRQGLDVQGAAALPSALCLAEDLSENYWHWIYEKLPKVILAEAAGFDGSYIVPPPAFATDSLRRLGIAERRIVVSQGQSFRVGALLLSPRLIGTTLLDQPELLARLRAALLGGVIPGGGRRLYLARKSGGFHGRRIVNEEAFARRIAAYGFEEYQGEGRSLDRQIADFAAAEAVIGPHGAAFTNTLFMAPGSLVVEAFSPLYVMYHIHPAVRLLGLRHHPLFPEVPVHETYGHGLDVLVDLDWADTVLSRELGQASAAATSSPPRSSR